MALTPSNTPLSGSPRIGEKCTFLTETSSPIPSDQKCLLCMKAVASKAFACIEEDAKKRFLCTYECFKKYYAVPVFTLDPSAKKGRRQLKFEVSSEDGAISAQYQIKNVIMPKKGESNGQKD